MDGELDDTRTAPSRPGARVTLQSPESGDDLIADTIMTSRNPAVDLVEPRREKATQRAINDALGLSPGDALPLAGIYSFRVGEFAEPVMLDRPARVGRDPRLSRVFSGTPPRLIRVSSPAHEVSATHVELRQVGSSVIVTDLRSTNGSVVLQPGSIPRKLRQGESVVVSPGALVDIGDENILQLLPMQRLGQSL
jgi:FHA domain